MFDLRGRLSIGILKSNNFLLWEGGGGRGEVRKKK